MIKKLRIKFISIVMAVAMLLVGGILGTVIYFTAQNMQTQSLSMMRAVASSPFQQMGPGQFGGDQVRLPFFTVQISSHGRLISASGGYYDLSDREQLQELVDEALDEDGEYGRLEDQDLRFLKAITPMGYTIVFADTSTEDATLKNLAISSGVIFLVAMLVFFGISILLSRWAIKPVAKAWEQQRQFVADASHELKTPLSVIMANAELAQTEDCPDPKKYTGNILSATYQMRSLVESMLEMARVDNGQVKGKQEDLDFSQMVQDAVLSFGLLYEEKGLGLRAAVKDGIRVRGCEQQLYQVMDVLLDNAMKYSTPGGMVTVRLVQPRKGCVLSVTSPGEPISREDLKNIFKRFYRADKARAMNGSYGLGLSIAEAIVLEHKGRIWADTQGGYNTFFVQLPAIH